MLFYLLFLVLINFIQCIPLEDSKTPPDVKQKISDSVTRISIKIATAKDKIDYVVDAAQSSLDKQYLQLLQLEQLAKFEVNLTNVDIKDCLKDLDDFRQNLNLTGLEQCQFHNIVPKANENVMKTKNAAKDFYEECLKSKQNSKEGCILELQQTLDSKLQILKRKVISELEKAEKDSFKCVEGNLMLLVSKIDVAAHKFKNCYIRKNEEKISAFY